MSTALLGHPACFGELILLGQDKTSRVMNGQVGNPRRSHRPKHRDDPRNKTRKCWVNSAFDIPECPASHSEKTSEFLERGGDTIKGMRI